MGSSFLQQRSEQMKPHTFGYQIPTTDFRDVSDASSLKERLFITVCRESVARHDVFVHHDVFAREYFCVTLIAFYIVLQYTAKKVQIINCQSYAVIFYQTSFSALQCSLVQ